MRDRVGAALHPEDFPMVTGQAEARYPMQVVGWEQVAVPEMRPAASAAGMAEYRQGKMALRAVVRVLPYQVARAAMVTPAVAWAAEAYPAMAVLE